MIKIDARQPEPALIGQAAAILKKGGVIAYPTETFYALGADASNAQAIARIFEIKGRSFKSPIALIAGSENDLAQITDQIPDGARILMSVHWPGPLTLVFAAITSPTASLLSAGTGKIGVRISSHPIAQALAHGLGVPITATSANRSGQKECITAGEVAAEIGPFLDMIIDGGPTPGGKGSTFLDVTQDPPYMLREGAISRKDLYL